MLWRESASSCKPVMCPFCGVAPFSAPICQETTHLARLLPLCATERPPTCSHGTAGGHPSNQVLGRSNAGVPADQRDCSAACQEGHGRAIWLGIASGHEPQPWLLRRWASWLSRRLCSSWSPTSHGLSLYSRLAR